MQLCKLLLAVESHMPAVCTRRCIAHSVSPTRHVEPRQHHASAASQDDVKPAGQTKGSCIICTQRLLRLPLAPGTLLFTDGMTPSLMASFRYWAPCRTPCSAAVTAAAEERTPCDKSLLQSRSSMKALNGSALNGSALNSSAGCGCRCLLCVKTCYVL